MRALASTASIVVASLAPSFAAAHEAGAPFSGAILDPLVLHHAHIENEQRLNLTAARTGAGSGFRGASFGAKLELSSAAPSYDFRVEAFSPFSNLPDSGAGRVSGVGDIALRPIKFSPRETSTERGLGEGYVAVGGAPLRRSRAGQLVPRHQRGSDRSRRWTPSRRASNTAPPRRTLSSRRRAQVESLPPSRGSPS